MTSRRSALRERPLSYARAAVLLFLACGSACVRAADSQDIPSLLAKKHCMACHQNDQMLVGPPFIAITVRYSINKEEMVEVLAHKIIDGGGGKWGLVPMVPNDHVTIEEARSIARWILSRPLP